MKILQIRLQVSRRVLRQSNQSQVNRMKKLLVIFVLTLLGLHVSAQENPVKWTFDSKKTSAGTYELYLSATVPQPWHIYSQKTPEGGPLPTKIQFKANPLVNLSGEASEQGDVKNFHDKNFDVDVIYFAGDVKFVQVVKLKASARTSVKGAIEYMVCNDNKCLPPVTVPFDIIIN